MHLCMSVRGGSENRRSTMMMRLLLLCVAATCAFELPSVVSRRTFAQAVAAAPLAIATSAFADADNKYLGVGKAGVGGGNIAKYGEATEKAIGRPGALTDASGAAAPKGIALGSTAGVAASVGPPGSEKTVAQINAMKRLMK